MHDYYCVAYVPWYDFTKVCTQIWLERTNNEVNKNVYVDANSDVAEDVNNDADDDDDDVVVDDDDDDDNDDDDYRLYASLPNKFLSNNCHASSRQ